MGEMKINLNVSTEDETDKSAKKISVLESKQSSNTKVTQETTKNKPAKDDKEYISSLFNHNPEIPAIEQAEFEPAKEDVFSAKTFDQLNLDQHLVKNLSELGLKTLTTIQSKALPVIMGKEQIMKQWSLVCETSIWPYISLSP